MPICETCGNDYDKAFRMTFNGKEHVFDSFECAIQALAPTCPHCGTRIIGHGVEMESIALKREASRNCAIVFKRAIRKLCPRRSLTQRA